jgi:hypothetical protein
MKAVRPECPSSTPTCTRQYRAQTEQEVNDVQQRGENKFGGSTPSFVSARPLCTCAHTPAPRAEQGAKLVLPAPCGGDDDDCPDGPAEGRRAFRGGSELGDSDVGATTPTWEGD